MPYWEAVLFTRRAISPRLAISMLFNGSVDSGAGVEDVDVAFHLRLRLGNIEALVPRMALNRAAEDISKPIYLLSTRQRLFHRGMSLYGDTDFKCFEEMKSNAEAKPRICDSPESSTAAGGSGADPKPYLDQRDLDA